MKKDFVFYFILLLIITMLVIVICFCKCEPRLCYPCENFDDDIFIDSLAYTRNGKVQEGCEAYAAIYDIPLAYR